MRLGISRGMLYPDVFFPLPLNCCVIFPSPSSRCVLYVCWIQIIQKISVISIEACDILYAWPSRATISILLHFSLRCYFVLRINISRMRQGIYITHVISNIQRLHGTPLDVSCLKTIALPQSKVFFMFVEYRPSGWDGVYPIYMPSWATIGCILSQPFVCLHFIVRCSSVCQKSWAGKRVRNKGWFFGMKKVREIIASKNVICKCKIQLELVLPSLFLHQVKNCWLPSISHLSLVRNKQGEIIAVSLRL
jgi:hypothetical protein